MVKKIRLNLLTGIQKINALKKRQGVWLRLSIAERSKLLEIRNTLRVAIHIPKNWLNGEKGILWQYHMTGAITHLTQSKLAAEAKQAQLDVLKFVDNILNKLYFNLTQPKGLYFSLASNPKLSSTLLTIINAINANLAANASWKNSDHEYDLTEYQSFYDNTLHIYQITTHLNGRYIPAIQALDPLKGMVLNENAYIPSGGLCWGHVGSWSLSIEKNIKYVVMQSLDRHVINFQHSDIRDFVTISQNKFHSPMDLWSSLEEAFKDVDSKYTYAVSLALKTRSHVMGLRQIRSTREIEFYDPNFGIFILPNMHIFKVWFSNLYNLIYLDYFQTGVLKLKKLHAQPYHATPTVPSLKPDFTRLKNEELWLPAYAKYSDYIFRFIDDFVASLHFWGYIDHSKINIDIENQLMEMRALHLAQYVKSSIIPAKVDFKLDVLHHSLKNSVLKAIDREQNRLMKQILSPGSILLKLNALDSLKHCVKKAAIGASLKVTIDTWLMQKNTKGQYQRDVINKQRISFFQKKTTTLDFIQGLLKHYEINPLILSMLQDKVFLKVYETLNHIKSINTPIFKILFVLIKSYDPSKDNVLEILLQIQQIAASSTLADISPQIVKFYGAMSELQLTDPSSLTSTYHALNNLT